MKNAFEVIIAPVVTEKTNSMVANKKYTFRVNPAAGKIEIAKAVEEIFKVKVASVNVQNRQGKAKRVGRGNPGRKVDTKRAVITLAEGSIEMF